MVNTDLSTGTSEKHADSRTSLSVVIYEYDKIVIFFSTAVKLVNVTQVLENMLRNVVLLTEEQSTSIMHIMKYSVWVSGNI